jgi:uncharacterized protein YceH (UPF0502 family)
MLDVTQQRIIGVLIEKELSVPDYYPMTENALLAGCNQRSNRDPILDLQDFELNGALLALREASWVTRVEGGGRAWRYKHNTDERIGVDRRQKAVLAELLIRGPQAPGALKPRVQRMGLHAEPDEIEAILRELAARPKPLVELLPRGPRERQARWMHLLGPRDARQRAGETDSPEPAVPRSASPDTDRLARLEQEVEVLRNELDALRARVDEAIG